MTILPLTYLGSVEWFAALMQPESVVDLGENYVKQSCRNRCRILSANGVMDLTVNVVKGGSMHKKPVRDMRIDYSKRWQHEHWRSILSAYKSSPYYDYYVDDFQPLYQQRFEFLADLNLSLARLLVRLSGLNSEIRTAENYLIPTPADRDMRSHDFLAPSVDLGQYYQVFSERYAFEPNLSAIDLLFCEGADGLKGAVRRYAQCL